MPFLRLFKFKAPFGPNNKYSKLHLAVMNKCREKLETLLDAGADPKRKDWFGKSVYDQCYDRYKNARIDV